jgi:hypothetical protein
MLRDDPSPGGLREPLHLDEIDGSVDLDDTVDLLDDALSFLAL